MKLFLYTERRPVQEVAAEPETLKALADILRAASPKQQHTPGPQSPIGSLTGFPLVCDPSVPRGFVYLRPSRRPNRTDQERHRP